MGKVIKVIDLLNMIANREELPKKIKHLKEEYQVINRMGFVSCESKSGLCLDLVQCLNDEVEILDEEQQDIDIQKIEVLPEYKVEDVDCYDCNSIKCNRYAINNLIKAVKQLDKQIKEK